MPADTKSPSNDADIPSAMSTSGLQAKLRQLKERSAKHSQLLTAKLASSQSGQNLLHIGTSLSTLPPDLHSLLTQLHPVLSAAESTEKQYLQRLTSLVECGNAIRTEQRRVAYANDCAEVYRDLLTAETIVKDDDNESVSNTRSSSIDEVWPLSTLHECLDHTSALERCAHTTLYLVQDLQSSTQKLSNMTAATTTSTTAVVVEGVTTTSTATTLPSLRSALDEDTERAYFLMKLAPRIRRLEADTLSSLTTWMEKALKQFERHRTPVEENHNNTETVPTQSNGSSSSSTLPAEEELLLMLGNCMRAIALLGRGKEAESIFARVAIMPLIRTKLSMGRLDEGGSRGECAGLVSLLKDIITSIATTFGPLLQLAESMFSVGSSNSMAIDLVTAGVWAPIATALMADAGIRMVIFSPGIASVLQRNYIVLDAFLCDMANQLLTTTTTTGNEHKTGGATSVFSPEHHYFRPAPSIETVHRAQERIFSHVKTAEFSKKWNLPIYYQLRFGESCNRLDKAIENTRQEGWIAEVYTGSSDVADSLKNTLGFEISFFLELYDTLLGLWRPDVILQPLSNRFLRGAVQLVGRTVAFIKDGMDGQIKFGQEPVPAPEENGAATNGVSLPYPSQSSYSWGDSAHDVAAVAWELAILETALTHDFVATVAQASVGDNVVHSQKTEIDGLIREVLTEASNQISPLVQRAWNELIVGILVAKCSSPLSAVKGVAATYRMTNRPPPTQASPYVNTILRPLKEFNDEFANRVPLSVGDKWKMAIVDTVTTKYSMAVEELITTVQRTETTLQNRRNQRRAASGGVSDGDKVKLQVYLDFRKFEVDIEDLGIDCSLIPGVEELHTITAEGKQLFQQTQT